MYEKIFPGIQLEHNQIETESEKNIFGATYGFIIQDRD